MLLAVGRFVARKCSIQTLRAFSLLCRDPAVAWLKLELSMVGHGPLLVSARLSVEALGLQERVHFLGVCTQDRLAQLMRELR